MRLINLKLLPSYLQTLLTQSPGGYVSKTNEQWSLVKDFFKEASIDVDFDSDSVDANSVVHVLNNSLYNYFKEHYGTVKCQIDKALVL